MPEDVVIQLGGTSFHPSTNMKNFGLHMDRYILFDTHINELSKKVIEMWIYISRVCINFDKTTKQNFCTITCFESNELLCADMGHH